MEINEVTEAIRAALPDSQIEVEGEGCSFSAVVVTAEFEGLTPVKRQQKVLSAVQPWLTSGALHAISLRTYTPAELEKARAANAAGPASPG